MKILAYDSSSEVLSVALYDGQTKIGGLDSPLFTRHSATLAPSLDILLKAHRVSLGDIEVIAVGLGPGSFTGLRVGITTAKVLAYALKKRIVGVSSLEVIAWGCEPEQEGDVAVILDAKKGKVYAALYRREDQRMKAVQKPALTERSAFLSRIKRPCRILDDKEALLPKADNVAKAAVNLIREKKFIDPHKLEPLYLHPRTCNVIRK